MARRLRFYEELRQTSREIDTPSPPATEPSPATAPAGSASSPTYAEKLVSLQHQDLTPVEQLDAAYAVHQEMLHDKFQAGKIDRHELLQEGERLQHKSFENLLTDARQDLQTERNKVLDVQRHTGGITQEQWFQGRRATSTMSLDALARDARARRDLPTASPEQRLEASSATRGEEVATQRTNRVPTPAPGETAPSPKRQLQFFEEQHPVPAQDHTRER